MGQKIVIFSKPPQNPTEILNTNLSWGMRRNCVKFQLPELAPFWEIRGFSWSKYGRIREKLNIFGTWAFTFCTLTRMHVQGLSWKFIWLMKNTLTALFLNLRMILSGVVEKSTFILAKYVSRRLGGVKLFSYQTQLLLS